MIRKKRRANLMPIMEHLGQLRQVLVVSTITILTATSLVFGLWQKQAWNFVVGPLKEYDVALVNIGLPEALFAKFKVCLVAGILVSLPIICWQVWSFLAPALVERERKVVALLAPMSILLFLAGASFAYWGVFGYAARFLLIIAGDDIKPMLSVGQYVSFLISFLVPFGLIFELPLASYLLSRLEIITPGWLRRNRKYAILGIFALSAVLTPTTDAISQLMMAGPMMVLYEASVVVSRLSSPRRKMTCAPSSAGG